MATSKVPITLDGGQEHRRFLDTLALSLDGLTTTTIGAAGTTQTEFISGVITIPANKDYRIVEKIPYAATLTGFTAKTSTGTITATLKINSTAVTTGAISVTSSQASVTPSALNTMVATDALVLTLSSNSSAADVSFTVTWTRVLNS